MDSWDRMTDASRRLRAVLVAIFLLIGLLGAGCATEAPVAEGDGATEVVDPESGLDWVDVRDLPAEAHDTLALIDAGGPFPYDKDGSTFGNFEGILPEQDRGYYREYTVETPGLDHRGPLRIVTGDEDGGDVEYYWTEDHYESFERIRR